MSLSRACELDDIVIVVLVVFEIPQLILAIFLYYLDSLIWLFKTIESTSYL